MMTGIKKRKKQLSDSSLLSSSISIFVCLLVPLKFDRFFLLINFDFYIFFNINLFSISNKTNTLFDFIPMNLIQNNNKDIIDNIDNFINHP